MGNMPNPVITFAMIQSRWNTTKLAIGKAKDADKTECERAKQYAVWHDCKDTDSLVNYANDEMGTLDGVVAEVDGHVQGLAAKDVVSALLTKRDGWATTKKDVDTIREDVDKMRMDKWVGDAKEQYQSLIPTQLKALDEMSGLATSQGTACDNIALVNAQMFVAVLDGINQLHEFANSNSTAYYNDSAESIGSPAVGWQDARYIWRTLTLRDRLNAFKTWLIEQSDADLADWSTPSKDLNTSLTTLTGSTTNLQSGGVWPGIGLRVADDASNTGDATTSQTNQTDPTLNQSGSSYGWD